jgi:hypothetical protein
MVERSCLFRRLLVTRAHLFQLNRDVLDRLISLFWIFCETPTHNPLQIVRHVGIKAFDRWRVLADDLIERVDRIFSVKRLVSSDRFVKKCSRKKNIGPLIDFVLLCLVPVSGDM